MAIKNYLTATSGWCLVEADYAQLEIRVLALATGCPQLIADILSGMDLHRYFASRIYGKPEAEITDAERKLAKGFSFQLQYGAGWKSISKFWNVDPNLVKRFIKEYYARYPEVEEWQQANIDHVEHTGDFEGIHLTGARPEPIKSAFVQSIWPDPNMGRFAIDQKAYDKNIVFPGTQIKNYPIQGGAADIVLLMLNKLRKELSQSHWGGRVIMVGTVHDSFLFEVQRGDGASVIGDCHALQQLLSSVPTLLHEQFGIESPVPFPVDVELGLDWGNMIPLDKFSSF